MDVTEQLARVDATTVTAVAQQAIGSPTAQVVGWEHQVVWRIRRGARHKLPAADQRLGDG